MSSTISKKVNTKNVSPSSDTQHEQQGKPRNKNERLDKKSKQKKGNSTNKTLSKANDGTGKKKNFGRNKRNSKHEKSFEYPPPPHHAMSSYPPPPYSRGYSHGPPPYGGNSTHCSHHYYPHIPLYDYPPPQYYHGPPNSHWSHPYGPLHSHTHSSSLGPTPNVSHYAPPSHYYPPPPGHPHYYYPPHPPQSYSQPHPIPLNSSLDKGVKGGNRKSKSRHLSQSLNSNGARVAKDTTKCKKSLKASSKANQGSCAQEDLHDKAPEKKNASQSNESQGKNLKSSSSSLDKNSKSIPLQCNAIHSDSTIASSLTGGEDDFDAELSLYSATCISDNYSFDTSNSHNDYQDKGIKKNSQSQYKTTMLKKRMQKILSKTSTDRTPEEHKVVQLYEERRHCKNGNSREKPDEKQETELLCNNTIHIEEPNLKIYPKSEDDRIDSNRIATTTESTPKKRKDSSSPEERKKMKIQTSSSLIPPSTLSIDIIKPSTSITDESSHHDDSASCNMDFPQNVSDVNFDAHNDAPSSATSSSISDSPKQIIPCENTEKTCRNDFFALTPVIGQDDLLDDCVIDSSNKLDTFFTSPDFELESSEMLSHINLMTPTLETTSRDSGIKEEYSCVKVEELESNASITNLGSKEKIKEETVQKADLMGENIGYQHKQKHERTSSNGSNYDSDEDLGNICSSNDNITVLPQALMLFPLIPSASSPFEQSDSFPTISSPICTSPLNLPGKIDTSSSRSIFSA
eukprot:CAMPEP_0184868840 /NCGR_PEP_ID=MMETSP0580-20130426/31936_1 /TAXON_ID=1118495 /ORGANISM="Dactyliosolen fragilissimus" /LENGTH=740 /DNA_ID=CAMNT_0027369979 /DNA_START=384 /DNA_END=2606 /DNA_ORIENTATION=-